MTTNVTDFVAAYITCIDTWVEHPQGQIFVRIWDDARNPDRADEKAPIVLFHDSLGCVELWRDFPARLSAATGRKIIAYDRLGFGKSTPRSGRLAPDFIADEARCGFSLMRQQLGIEKFVAFGHSVGGAMAVNCAAHFAGDCEAVISESAQAFVDEQIVQGILAAKQQFKDPRQVERLEKYHGAKARWVLEAWTETWTDPAYASWSLADALVKVVCPALVLHGMFDEYGSTQHPAMIGRLCGGPLRVELLADTYHVPHRERPETIVNLVAGLLCEEACR